MIAACRCRSGGTTILPASWPAMERSRNASPAITRMVGIGVSFNAVMTLSITHLPLCARLSSAGSLRVDRTQHVEKSSAIIAQSRGAPRSAYLYTPIGEMRPWVLSGSLSVTMPQEVLAWFVGEVWHTMNCVSWQCCAEPLEYAR
jgi:hypothetical protein